MWEFMAKPQSRMTPRLSALGGKRIVVPDNRYSCKCHLETRTRPVQELLKHTGTDLHIKKSIILDFPFIHLLLKKN